MYERPPIILRSNKNSIKTKQNAKYLVYTKKIFGSRPGK